MLVVWSKAGNELSHISASCPKMPSCPFPSLILFFRGSHLFLPSPRFFLSNSFCDEHQSPSAWQTMSERVPLLRAAAFQANTCPCSLTGAWTILHIIAPCTKPLASVSNRGCEAISQNKADSVTAPLNNLSSLFYPLFASISTTEMSSFAGE